MTHGVKAVKYIGIADTRIITADQWREEQGIRGQDTVVWNKANGFTVLGDRLKADAIKHLKEDPNFAVFLEESTA